MTEMSASETMRALPRFWRFLRKPLHDKSRSLYVRWKRMFPGVPFLMRLPFGAWWIARDDYLGSTLTCDGFERAERVFVERFLKPGMNVIDIGAHHGFYTLLMSKRVRGSGRVLAFEPSPRERKALLFHTRLNRCKNVEVHKWALGSLETNACLHVVQGFQTGFNSLRPPAVSCETRPVSVHVVRLDDWLAKHKIGHVDFMKIDVEGGELEMLKGAQLLLERQPRPLILVEVQDARTLPWGYRAKDIIEYLEKKGYRWFNLSADGFVEELNSSCNGFDGNYLACPEESLKRLAKLRDSLPLSAHGALNG
jgi:FkbM family methyltransferase